MADNGTREATEGTAGIITLYILFTREQREGGTGIRESDSLLSNPFISPLVVISGLYIRERKR